MKKFTILIICGAMLHYSHAWASETNDPPANPKPGMTLLELGVFIGLSAVVLGTATWMIVKVWAKAPDNHSQVTLVLEKSYNATPTAGGGYSGGDWTPIATNTVVLNGITPLEVFQDRMTDRNACYRAQIQR